MGEHVNCEVCDEQVHMDDAAQAAGWRIQMVARKGWLARCPKHPFPKNT